MVVVVAVAGVSFNFPRATAIQLVMLLVKWVDGAEDEFRRFDGWLTATLSHSSSCSALLLFTTTCDVSEGGHCPEST